MNNTVGSCNQVSLSSQEQEMSGSHSEIRHTRTTVRWSWSILVNMMVMPCSAWLTKLLVANIIWMEWGMTWGTGSSPMELEFTMKIHQVRSGMSMDPEARWWYVCTAEEVERRGSIAVRYLILWVSFRPYTLECTQVSGTCILHSVQLLSYCKYSR